MRLTLVVIISFSIFSCKRTTINEARDLTEQEIAVPSTQKCQLKNVEMVYEYLPDIEVPEHLFTIVLSCTGDNLHGTIFGPDPEGEHGLYFFLADLDKLKMDKFNSIEFESNQGNLLTKQVTLDNYKGTHEDVGLSRSILSFKGTNYIDSLVLHCISKYDECYANKMVFRLKTSR